MTRENCRGCRHYHPKAKGETPNSREGWGVCWQLGGMPSGPVYRDTWAFGISDGPSNTTMYVREHFCCLMFSPREDKP